MSDRWVFLDTETTGLEVRDGHKIIEIGCVEVRARVVTDRRYHMFVNPQREIDAGAVNVHGITNDDVKDKPVFADVADTFMEFVKGAEVIIHNADFDVGFLNAELKASGKPSMIEVCGKITDSLLVARKRHQGQRNSLDALCKRYNIDSSERTVHGALLDATLLAKVYLSMTAGQSSLDLDGNVAGAEVATSQAEAGNAQQAWPDASGHNIKVIAANEDELAADKEIKRNIKAAITSPES